MYYLINYTESITESRGFRNEKFSDILGNTLLISGSWSHTHKSRIISTSDKELLLDNWSYKKNIGIKRILSAWHFAYLLRRKILKDNIEIEGCIISSINLEALILLPKSKIKKIIIDVRDIWPDAHPLSFKSLPFYIYTKILNLFIKRYSSNYLYVSPSFKKWIKKNCILENAIYLPLCYNPQRWGKPLINKTIHNNKVLKMGYIGNLNSQFSLDEMLPLIGKSNVLLEIVGGGEKINKLKKLIKDESYKNRITFYGYLDRESSTKIVKSWDLGIVPQTTDCKADLPNKFFDYLGAGIPIIAFDDTWLGSYIKENEIGFSVSRNATYCDFQTNLASFKKNVINYRENYSADRRYRIALNKLFNNLY